MPEETILVTGSAGYIGSLLTWKLLSETKMTVIGLDNLMYGNGVTALFYNNPRFKFIRGDLSNVDHELFRKANYVVNLAALVGEPICKKSPEQAWIVNCEAPMELANSCEIFGTERFICCSTCSNYGVSDNYASEESELKPASLYAKTKVMLEQRIQDMPKLDYTILRFATAYGLSLRNRFDLLLHEFIRDAWSKRELKIFGGSFYRPMCHIEDICQAIMLCLSEDKHQKVSRQVFNVGSTKHNFTKMELAKMVEARIPCEVVEHKDAVDPRNYRVSFQKFSKVGFTVKHDPESTVGTIASALESGVLTTEMMQRSANV